MSQSLVLLLLALALVLPLIGATVLRLLGGRLGERQSYVIAAVVLAIAVASVALLARSDVSRVQVAGLTVLLPVVAPVEDDLLPRDLPLPAEPPDDVGTSAPTATGAPTSAPTATRAPTATPEPTATSAPTPEPSATAEPTAEPTATSAPTPEPTFAPTAPPAPPPAPRRYTVQPGDTIRAIAERFGITVTELLRANNLAASAADTIRPGQELVIP